MVREDCFAFRRRNDTEWCDALSKIDCEDCVFYKRYAQVILEDAKSSYTKRGWRDHPIAGKGRK